MPSNSGTWGLGLSGSASPAKYGVHKLPWELCLRSHSLGPYYLQVLGGKGGRSSNDLMSIAHLPDTPNPDYGVMLAASALWAGVFQFVTGAAGL